MQNKLEIITVDLASRSYPIIISNGLLKNTAILEKYLPQQQLFFVSNEVVAPLYLKPLMAQLSQHRKVNSLTLPDGEYQKTLANLEKIFDKLLQENFDRAVALCSLGGGVVGDMTGFAASCYRRGVDFIQIPTTLLAQVDAAVGGKTAVNHPLGKNMIGAFYQPKAVLIDVDTLSTLPDREFSAGLAEVVKTAVIKDKAFFDWLIDNSEKIISRDNGALIHLIKRCCEIKATVVAKDEKEHGLRAILNFGHTFGHAIEAITEYKVYLHGEAVALGMVAAGALSYNKGNISEAEFLSLGELLRKFNLPTLLKDPLDNKLIKKYMSHDKKQIDGQLKLILLKQVGEASITTNFSEAEVDAALAEISLQKMNK